VLVSESQSELALVSLWVWRSALLLASVSAREAVSRSDSELVSA
jgi:hypothetical protein